MRLLWCFAQELLHVQFHQTELFDLWLPWMFANLLKGVKSLVHSCLVCLILYFLCFILTAAATVIPSQDTHCHLHIILLE